MLARYRNDDLLTVGGLAFQAQSASKEVGLIAAGSAYRFQINKGDCAPFDNPSTRERSEVCATTKLPFGTLITADFFLRVAAGPVTDRGWIIPIQVHGDDALTAASPVFALNIMPVGGNEVIRVDACWGTNASPTFRTYAAQALPFSRGVLHRCGIAFIDGNGAANAGRIFFAMDGVTSVDLTAVTTGLSDAAPNTSYPKLGVYAGVASQAADKELVIEIINPVIKIG